MPMLAACAAIAIAGCGDDDSSSESGGADSTAAEAGKPSAEKTKPQVEVPQGAPPAELVTEDLEPGSGAEANPATK